MGSVALSIGIRTNCHGTPCGAIRAGGESESLQRRIVSHGEAEAMTDRSMTARRSGFKCMLRNRW
jgi:hypothetical protein